MMNRVACTSTGLLALAVVGCASARYVPRNRCLLSTVVVDGRPRYYVGGRVVRGGPLGGALTAATAGVPLAERYAARADAAGSNFLLLYVGGLATMMASPVLVIAQPGLPTYSARSIGIAGALGLATAGLAMASAGIYQLTKMEALTQDAINAYNDGVTLGGLCPAERPGTPAELPAQATAQGRE